MAKKICPCCGNETSQEKFCEHCGAYLVNKEEKSQQQQLEEKINPNQKNQGNALKIGFFFCPVCGKETKGGQFCLECGSLLYPQGEKTGLPIIDLNKPAKKPVNTSVSDEGLEMLINTCHKTMATVGGDGYKEYVLYKRAENVYELHYYAKYEYMENEVHDAYQSDISIVKEAFHYIETLDLEKPHDHLANFMAGGMFIVKYKKGNDVIRITNEQLSTDLASKLYKIESIITKTANDNYHLD